MILYFWHRFPIHHYCIDPCVNILSTLQWNLVSHQSFGGLQFSIWIPTSLKHWRLAWGWPTCLCEQFVMIEIFTESLCDTSLHVYIKRWIDWNFMPVKTFCKNNNKLFLIFVDMHHRTKTIIINFIAACLALQHWPIILVVNVNNVAAGYIIVFARKLQYLIIELPFS